MNLNELQWNWNKLGEANPFWAVLTDSRFETENLNEEEFYNTGRRFVARLNSTIERHCPDLNRMKALDFGCGVGRLTLPLADHFEEVIGIDIAPSMLKVAREKNQKKNCSFILNDKADLAIFENNSFDAIFTFITLQHMRPTFSKRFIAEFLRILKPSGVLIFQIPAKENSIIAAKIPWLKNLLYKTLDIFISYSNLERAKNGNVWHPTRNHGVVPRKESRNTYKCK